MSNTIPHTDKTKEQLIAELEALQTSQEALQQQVTTQSVQLEKYAQQVKVQTQALRKLKHRFRALVEQSPFSIQIYALDGSPVLASEAWLKMWCTTRNQLEGYNLLSDSQLEALGLIGEIQRAFAGESVALPPIFYSPAINNNKLLGCARWVEAFFYPLKDEAGTVWEVVAVYLDARECKPADLALQRSDERLSCTILEAPLPMILYAEDGEILKVNQTWTDVTGYSLSEIPTIAAWVEKAYGKPAEDINAAIACFYNLDKPQAAGECIITTCSGETRIWDFHCTPFGKTPDGRRLIFTTALDVTDRKQTEIALRESEERLRLALDATKVGIWDGNILTQQVTWSSRCEELFGFDLATFDGTYEAFEACIHPEDRDCVRQALNHARRSRYDYHQEFRIVWSDGSIHWLESKGKFFYNEVGEAARILGTVVDISDRKLAEAALQTANNELESRVAKRTAELSQANESLQRELLERSRVEQALRESESRFRRLFESNVVGVFFADFSGRITDANDLFLQILGYTREDLLAGRIRWDEIAPPELSHLVGEAMDRSQSTRVGVPCENEFIGKDGRQVPVLIRSALLEGCNDQIVAFVLDISDRKIAEVERAKLIDILEATPDFILSSSVDGQVLYFNRAARNILGLSQDWEIGKFDITDSHPDWACEVIRNEGIPAAMRDGSWIGETALISYDGREIPLSQLIIAHKGADGNVKLLSIIARDITQQKQVEAILREAERRWRSLLENVRLLVVGLDNTNKVEFVNCFFLELTGYTQAEVLGKSWFEMVLPPRLRQQVQIVFREDLEPEFHPHYTNAILTKSGEERTIAWNNTQLKNLQGEVIGTMSIGEDITERHVVEQMKNEFISIVSHELRTPLTAIRGSLGILATGALNNHPQRMQRMIEIAEIDTERLVRLVNDILDLERLESGKVTPVKEYCDVTALMVRSAEAMQSLAQKENIMLFVSPVSALVWASSDHIMQTLTNLLSNAIKFSPPNSTVSLTAQHQTDYVLFQVKDQGRGIPAKKLESIFGRFQQVDVSDARLKGGTGLGLAICRTIITQHGGRIWAESVLYEGSTFYFTLPLSPEQP